MSQPNEDDVDPGPPLTELADLRESPGEGFIERIRASIHRRMVVAQSSDLAMPIFLRTLLEYVSMVFSLFESSGSEERPVTDAKGKQPDDDAAREPRDEPRADPE